MDAYYFSAAVFIGKFNGDFHLATKYKIFRFMRSARSVGVPNGAHSQRARHVLASCWFCARPPSVSRRSLHLEFGASSKQV